jgi:ADP-ribose pyrophosphatase
MRDEKTMKWKLLGSTPLIDRPWLSARRDRVQLPNGKVNDEYYVLHYPTWVNIIAETADGQILLERQYRHALGVVSTEIPAGVVEKGETPLQGAQRELMEETGYSGGEWSELMTIAPNASSQDNLTHCFLARGVVHTGRQHFDETEDLDVFLLPKDQVFDLLKQGRFIQAQMVAPLWKYLYMQR